MRLSRQSALALALLLGLLAVGLAYWALFYDREQAPPEPERVQVPVPREVIPANTDLRSELFETATFDGGEVPKDTITDSAQLSDRITLRELEEGTPVPAGAVVKRSISRALAYGIPENYRAMTVAVDDVSGVANFIRPGDYIDLIGLFTDSTGELSVAITVLQDTLVLAVNTTTSPPDPDEKESEDEPKSRRGEDRRMVTLGITAHEAQLLALSDFRGELRMTLRRTGDHGLEILPRSQSWSLVGSYPGTAGRTANGGFQPDQASSGWSPTDMPSWARTWGMPPEEGGPASPTDQLQPAGIQDSVVKPTTKKPTVEVIRGFDRENVEPAQ